MITVSNLFKNDSKPLWIFQSCASLSCVVNYLAHWILDLGDKPIENLNITLFLMIRLLRLYSIGIDNFSGSCLGKGQSVLLFDYVLVGVRWGINWHHFPSRELWQGCSVFLEIFEITLPSESNISSKSLLGDCMAKQGCSSAFAPT